MKDNFAGFWGFIFALLGVVFGWLPYLGGIFWVLGAFLSFVGLFNPHKFWTVWGFGISFAWLIAYLILGFTIGSLAAFTLLPLV